MNAKGIRPETLETEEVISSKPKEIEPEFVDVVGQISLRTLEKNDRKKKFRNNNREQRDIREQKGQNQPPHQHRGPKNNNQRNGGGNNKPGLRTDKGNRGNNSAK